MTCFIANNAFLRLRRADLIFALALALVCEARAVEPTAADFHEFILSHAPVRGTAVATYRDTGYPVGTVIGYDVASGAWFVIRDAYAAVLEPGGDYYTSPPKEGFEAGLERTPARFRPYHGIIDRNMPVSYLLDIIHHADNLTSLTRLPDGSWSATHTFPRGDRDFNPDNWPEGFDVSARDLTVIVSPDGTPLSLTRGSETTVFDFAPDSPEGFPIAQRRMRMFTHPETGERSEAGRQLISFEWFPEGRPYLFSREAVLERAKSANTRRKEIMLLPPGVEWVGHDAEAIRSLPALAGKPPATPAPNAPERNVIAIPRGATLESLPPSITSMPPRRPIIAHPRSARPHPAQRRAAFRTPVLRRPDLRRCAPIPMALGPPWCGRRLHRRPNPLALRPALSPPSPRAVSSGSAHIPPAYRTSTAFPQTPPPFRSPVRCAATGVSTVQLPPLAGRRPWDTPAGPPIAHGRSRWIGRCESGQKCLCETARIR